MSTLDGVTVDVQDGDDEQHMVTASWSDGDTNEAAGVTVSRELVESGDLANVVTGLVDDIRQAVDERTDWDGGYDG